MNIIRIRRCGTLSSIAICIFSLEKMARAQIFTSNGRSAMELLKSCMSTRHRKFIWHNLLMASLFFAFFLPMNSYGKDIEVTIHVDNNYKPFCYEENGEAKGIYVKILKAAFSKMDGFAVTLKPVPWKRGKLMMKEGDGLGLTPAFFHGHDWPYLYPYSLPFYTETIVTICNRKILSEKRSNWPDDYQNLTIGNVAGFDGWGGDEFRALVQEGKIKYFESHGSEKTIKMLINERYDCIMMEKFAFESEIKRFIENGMYDEKKHPTLQQGAIIGTDSVYIGYSEPAIKLGKYPFYSDFRKLFDATIYKMIKSGEINIIISNYYQ